VGEGEIGKGRYQSLGIREREAKKDPSSVHSTESYIVAVWPQF
jgi:hypothetical protein